MRQNNAHTFILSTQILIKAGGVFIALLYLQMGFAQLRPTPLASSIDSLLQTDHIYLVGRGTRSKANLIGKQFNLSDTNLTHIGLGYVEHGGLQIIHVSDVPGNQGNALQKESFSSFLAPNDLFYWAIWEMNATVDECHQLIKNYQSMQQRRIYFDASFQLGNNDTLYCSEFCYTLLQLMNPIKYFNPSISAPLKNAFYEAVLNRKELLYIPVDFFIQYPFVVKRMEWIQPN